LANAVHVEYSDEELYHQKADIACTCNTTSSVNSFTSECIWVVP